MSDAAMPAVRVDRWLTVSLLTAAIAGAGLAVGARVGAGALLVAVAAAQAVLTLVWVFGTEVFGRWGALVLATGAAAAADVSVSVWPHGRLGVLIAVFGLAVPAMFVHQLIRGAARVRLVASMSSIAALLFAVVALAALPQMEHDFVDAAHGGRVVAAAVLALASALVAGYAVDLVAPVPRIDPAVARGLAGLVLSIGVGGLVGYLMLRREEGFADGRSVFVGLVLGAAAGLLGLATAFLTSDAPEPRSATGRVLQPVIAALMPLAVLAPLAFLVGLAVRS